MGKAKRHEACIHACKLKYRDGIVEPAGRQDKHNCSYAFQPASCVWCHVPAWPTVLALELIQNDLIQKGVLKTQEGLASFLERAFAWMFQRAGRVTLLTHSGPSGCSKSKLLLRRVQTVACI